MRKLSSIFLIILLAVALTIPILANHISNTAMGTNVTNSDTNGFNDPTAKNDYGNNSSSINSNINNNGSITGNEDIKLTSGQLQVFKDIQHKLGALIKIIEGLKTTYGSNGNTGTLNALDQFEKQANSLNSEITAFVQNPTTEDINGKISSFQAREAALEQKVSVKENALLAQTTTKTVNNSPNTNKKNK